MWYQNIRSALFSFLTIHASHGQTDRQTDGQNSDSNTVRCITYSRTVKTQNVCDIFYARLIYVDVLRMRLWFRSAYSKVMKLRMRAKDNRLPIWSGYRHRPTFLDCLTKLDSTILLVPSASTSKNNTTRKCGNYSDVLPLKAARRDSISNFTSFGASNLRRRRTQYRFAVGATLMPHRGCAMDCDKTK